MVLNGHETYESVGFFIVKNVMYRKESYTMKQIVKDYMFGIPCFKLFQGGKARW